MTFLAFFIDYLLRRVVGRATLVRHLGGDELPDDMPILIRGQTCVKT
jgi:hypothetical protein